MNAQLSFYFGLAAVILSGQHLYGQPQSQGNPAKAVFETASVKKSVPQRSGGCKITPMRLSCTNNRLDRTIFWAYRLASYELQGMPSWAAGAFYDINASLEQKSPAALSRAENYKLVIAGLQDLFENRFHLKFHYEKQPRAGFRLVAKKGGLTVKPVTNVKGGYSYSSNIVDGHHVLTFNNYTMANVANALAGELACPVEDATGIEGRYDFKVQMPVDDDVAVSIYSALGDFGLKLETEKIETNVFVIDGIERPSEN